MNTRKYVVLAFVCFFIVFILGGKLLLGTVEARGASADAKDAPSADALSDDLQRSYQVDHYREVADSGPGRGANIYAHKCWVCHNQYQKEAPHLSSLFGRGKSPLADDALLDQIRNGSAGMPSFRTSLSEADIADVVSYLKSGKCCLEGEDLPPNRWYVADTKKWSVPTTLTGGVHGVVKIASGDPAEGIMVQLIAPNNVRTTVYTNADGEYEFPQMQSGAYTLRIATPQKFKPYRRDSVSVQGAAKLDDIMLERVSKVEALPPSPYMNDQLSGAEMLWNLPGTDEEKEAFHTSCGSGCHSYQQILRNHYDERSWRVMVERMSHRGGGPLINQPAQPVTAKDLAQDEVVIQWLARVRGPESQDPPLHAFPRPVEQGSSRVVVTEYELPRVATSAHDVYGDAQGNIWYTSHLSRNLGRLDPRTGIVTEYQIPLTPGALPGTHHAVVEKDGTVLFSENWSHKLAKFDPQTQKFTEVQIESISRINSAGFGDYSVAPDGYIWSNLNDTSDAERIDPNTGKIVARYPFTSGMSYDSLISPDGKVWAGGAPAGTAGSSAELLDVATGKMLNLSTGERPSAGRRGGFDPFGNPWFAGENGTLVEVDAKAKKIREYWPPTPYSPYTDFYAAMPDKNGEVWAGELHGPGFLRFNPKTGRWIEYAMPEPFAHSRWVWVDNSTTPVTVWYTDFSTERVVRIQPLD